MGVEVHGWEVTRLRLGTNINSLHSRQEGRRVLGGEFSPGQACSLAFLKNWCVIAFQYHVSFCCAPKWISYMYIYIYIPAPLGLPPPLSAITEHWAELPDLYGSFPLVPCSTHGRVCTNHKIPVGPTLPSPTVSTHLLFVFISTPALLIGSSVPFF